MLAREQDREGRKEQRETENYSCSETRRRGVWGRSEVPGSPCREKQKHEDPVTQQERRQSQKHRTNERSDGLLEMSRIDPPERLVPYRRHQACKVPCQPGALGDAAEIPRIRHQASPEGGAGCRGSKGTRALIHWPGSRWGLQARIPGGTSRKHSDGQIETLQVQAAPALSPFSSSSVLVEIRTRVPLNRPPDCGSPTSKNPRVGVSGVCEMSILGTGRGSPLSRLRPDGTMPSAQEAEGHGGLGADAPGMRWSCLAPNRVGSPHVNWGWWKHLQLHLHEPALQAQRLGPSVPRGMWRI